MAVPGVRHPAKIQRRNAFIPELRADKVFQALIFVDLRYRNFQPQGGLYQVVFDVFFVTPLLQASAVTSCSLSCGLSFPPRCHSAQHRFGVADAHVAVFIAGDVQFVAPFPLVVGIDIKGIGPFRNRAGREARQIDLFATADDKTIVKLIYRSRVFLSAGKWRKAAQRDGDRGA
jgi:hypothetical protein